MGGACTRTAIILFFTVFGCFILVQGIVLFGGYLYIVLLVGVFSRFLTREQAWSNGDYDQTADNPYFITITANLSALKSIFHISNDNYKIDFQYRGDLNTRLDLDSGHWYLSGIPTGKE